MFFTTFEVFLDAFTCFWPSEVKVTYFLVPYYPRKQNLVFVSATLESKPVVYVYVSK